jgi:hypothetical protein
MHGRTSASPARLLDDRYRTIIASTLPYKLCIAISLDITVDRAVSLLRDNRS